jgi:hypothetical protein
VIIPDKDGFFHCENKGCSYETDDLFELLEHNGVEYTWGVRLSAKHSFDMFKFLDSVDHALCHGDFEEIETIVQSALMLFINASSDELDDFIMESTIISESESLVNGIEKMLRSADE